MKDKLAIFKPVNSESEFTEPGVGDAQGSLVCCSPGSRQELDMTERLN